MTDLFIEKGGKKLRCGFTTGSCAAAASKAALLMLIENIEIHVVTIMTPKGIPYNAEITDITQNREEGYISCAVIKDGGDDPDVTTGTRIVAKVRLKDLPGITIDGGEGVGRVTKPGLDQPIGEAAINSVPRKMIKENLEEILESHGMSGKGVLVTISVPGGEELAHKTFNPKLGIVGGISILGTTGIVEPMSDEALLETIRVETKVRIALGRDILFAAPGNYGLSFLKENYGIDESLVVMSSNFIYDTVRIAVAEGFKRLLFVGHIGKLVKVAGGIKNTHSMYGDHRMEILSEISQACLDDQTFLMIKDKLSECVMTDEAVRIINETGKGAMVFQKMAEDIKFNIEKWSEGQLTAEVIVFSNENTELVATARAHEYVKEA
ncbi:cobalt-precorrin-5B (C(1))-methyltransferase CbiD [Butyrivibrio sp. YAB3001]|uniref:cobalt-precorrin-5B (C(1))-methyltransferase CbiD n=1 Tax=Butyrivibrio sp. YAB3001 TaxID=1520812 RepID=UPI0008F64B2D|nr:cobalt-precorrin-5B (C(1))-methyltransferase CbiD [Butyrivibrio sp. YAB3001]SFC54895.1 cobalt-precorrin-5B (C1)-methyltransferase [Butyrivibrio sp. YAB3001]